jgi:hypothetical protein
MSSFDRPHAAARKEFYIESTKKQSAKPGSDHRVRLMIAV